MMTSFLQPNKSKRNISSASRNPIKEEAAKRRRDHDDPFINRDKSQRGRVVYDKFLKVCQVNMFEAARTKGSFGNPGR